MQRSNYAHRGYEPVFESNGGTLASGSQSTVNISDNGDLVKSTRLVSGRALPDSNDYGVTVTDNKTDADGIPASVFCLKLNYLP